MLFFSSQENVSSLSAQLAGLAEQVEKLHEEERIEREIERLGLLCPLDVLLVGATGTGKSSTLNALFGSAVAKVGTGVDPETKSITSYKLRDYLRIHDSAGLGDGREADLAHAKNITQELLRTITVNGTRYKFMDMVMVVLDGGSRDLGTAFKLLESVVLKAIEPERVVVAINQADMAMKGQGWDRQANRPDEELKQFLDEKALSVQKRIRESTGLNISKPICYSALHGYNVSGFLDHMARHLPKARRR